MALTRRGAYTVKGDRLRALYAQMRKVKQVDLAMADGEKDPVRRA